MVNIDCDFAFKWYLYKGPAEDMGAGCGDEPTIRLHLYDNDNTEMAKFDCITHDNGACNSVNPGYHLNDIEAEPNGSESPFGNYLHISNSSTKTVNMRWEYYEDDCGSRCSYGTAFLCGDDYHVLKNYDWQIRGLTKHSLVVNPGGGTYQRSGYTDGWSLSTDWFANQLKVYGFTSHQYTWTGSQGPFGVNGSGSPEDKTACMRVKYRWNYTGNESELKPCLSETSVSWTADYPSWSFEAVAGNEYTFSMDVETTYGENILRILRSDGYTELANTFTGSSNSSCTSCPSSLTFTTPSTGTYYVDIINRTNFVTSDDGELSGASNDEGVLEPRSVPTGTLTCKLESGSVPGIDLSTNNAQICPTGGSTLLTAEGGASVYNWFKDGFGFYNLSSTYSATETGTYRVEAATASGCVLPSNTVVISNITSIPDPIVIATTRNGTGPILLGQEVTFNSSVSNLGTRTASHLWYDNTYVTTYPHPSTNASTYTFRAKAGHAIAGGVSSYAVSAGAGSGCYPNYEEAASDIIQLNTLIPEVTVESDIEYFCVGEGAVATLTAHAVNAGPNPYYQWVVDYVSIPGANGPTYTTDAGFLDNLLTGNNAHNIRVYVRPTRPVCLSCPYESLWDQVSDDKYIYHRLPTTWYVDADQDGYGTGTLVSVCPVDESTSPTGYSLNNTDCDDGNANVHEQFDFYVDADQDGYGTGTLVSVCAVDASTPPTGYSLNNTDCDDGNTNVHEQFDFYVDADQDGYGTGTLVSVCAVDASTPPTGYSLNNTDCDDTRTAVNPGATEIGNNGLDDDCDGVIHFLGTYPSTSVTAGQNTMVTPSAAPTGATTLNAFADAGFTGVLTVDPTTGVVTITDALQTGTYTVTVTHVSATASFTLTVINPDCAATYDAATDVTVGDGPQSIAIGDFNGDGTQDFATADLDNNNVSIRLGDGTGGFTSATDVSVGVLPSSIDIGDFNGDGMQDFATANYNDDDVSIRLGDGTGGFASATNVSVGGNPISIAIGDFNGDGMQDFATANFNGANVSIRLGNGTGGFTSPSDVSVGVYPISIAIGDFNGDGIQDFSTANQNDDDVSIRLGNGTGGFTSLTDVSVGDRPYSIAIGDFNGDGTQDFATANSNDATVSIRLGDGTGGFTFATDVSLGTNPYSIAIGDFNGDGMQDFATANVNVANVSIRLGNGTGVFTSATNVSVGGNPISIAIGDFNGDGIQDFATANSGGDNVSVRLGEAVSITGVTEVYVGSSITLTGNGTAATVDPWVSSNTGIATVDASGEVTGVSGGSTVITYTIDGGCSTDYTVNTNPIVLGTYPSTSVTAGQNTMVTPSAAPTGATTLNAFADAGFTGILTVDPATGVVTITDALQAGTYTVTVTHASATASFTLTVINPDCAATYDVATDVSVGDVSVIDFPNSIAIGDFNGDGMQDFATANYDDDVSIRLGDGTGVFISASDVSVGDRPSSIAIGDFNGDGMQDFATANQLDYTVSIRLGDGTGGFTSASDVSVGVYPGSIAIGDFNGDGMQDFATVNYYATVSIRLGDGTGVFTSAPDVSVGNAPQSIAIGDFNGDGMQDFVTANYNDDDVSIRLGDGTGVFTFATDVSVGNEPYSIAIGDFNGDGIQDFATANRNDDDVSIRLGDGTGVFISATDVSVGNRPLSIAIGDFNGDGMQDFATANSSDDNVSIRLGDGTGVFTSTSDVSVGDDPRSIAIGDFNGDGMQDFATANVNSDNVSVRLGEAVSITGATEVCIGSSITLTGNGTAATADPWVSSNPAVATVSSTGEVTGVSVGSTVITYTTDDGCSADVTVSVFGAASITGGTEVCAGSSINLTGNLTPAGVDPWVSSNPAVAAVSSTGEVTGVSGGSTVITYTTDGGCDTDVTVSVFGAASITGGTEVCAGSSITLTGNGTAATADPWVSSNPAVAAVSSTGEVTGVSGGSTVITYTTDGGCSADVTVSVFGAASITGGTEVCAGSIITLTGNGTAATADPWVSSNPAVAAVSSTGEVTGVSGGSTVITYTTDGGCNTDVTVFVFGAASITGGTEICAGSSITLTGNGTAATADPWVSSNPAVAAVSSTGEVTGVSGGSTVITYTTDGGCSADVTVSVFGAASITGGTEVCAGSIITLTGNGTAATVDPWVSSNPAVAAVSSTGEVTGVAVGSTVITYTTDGGCSADVTVSVFGAASIVGGTEVCAGSSINLTGNLTPAGVDPWVSSNPAVAAVSSTGEVTGVSGGSTVITYTTDGGCSADVTVTVASITGATEVCAGSIITLTGNGTAATADPWVSSNPAVAAVSSTGEVTGVSGGSTVITYTTDGGCNTDVTVSVFGAVSITGGTEVCAGSIITLTGNGTAATADPWVSSNPAVAAVSSTGEVTGVSGGSTVITYTTDGGCSADVTVSVFGAASITGGTEVCAGSIITLTGNGTAATADPWVSSNPAVAAVSSTGEVTGVSGGSTVITYTTDGGCNTDVTVFVFGAASITGGTEICAGSIINLTGNGTAATVDPWVSSNTGIATVDASGEVTGVSGGSTVITYTTDGGCSADVTVSVFGAASIAGGTAVCAGSSITLTGNLTPAGVDPWVSSNPAVAAVSSTGEVTGVSGGSTVITYTTDGGCSADVMVSVFGAASITGGTEVYVGSIITLTGNGTAATVDPWVSSNTGIATVDASGEVTGVSVGSTVITYTTDDGCSADVTVNTTIFLGTYPSTSVTAGQNTTVTPTAAPIGATTLNAFADAGFTGILTVDPTTGVVTITDALQAGTYTVTVTTTDVSATASFTLTVINPDCAATYDAATDVTIGYRPGSIAIGDFNGDGIQDFATANSNDANVSIRLGTGTGDFTSATDVSVGDIPVSIAIGDFNGDGMQDFATANSDDHTVSIRLGDGTGVFTFATDVSVGDIPVSIAIGDFNGDGMQDFVTANYYATVSIRLGDGTGVFTSATDVSVGVLPFSIAIGDFNGDGMQDFATANFDGDNVSIRLGDGTGVFTSASDVSVGNEPVSIAIGDFNGDGIQDFATANRNDDDVSIRLGDGFGVFTSAMDVSVGNVPYSIAIGDFNGDGMQDFATANSNDATVSIRLGDGFGVFTSATNVSVGDYPRSIAIGDFNGDGKQDFATANLFDDNVSIRLGVAVSGEINLQGKGVDIVSGDVTPSVTDNTDFATVALNVPTTKPYSIQNTGTNDILVSAIAISGADATLFTVGGIALPVTISGGNNAFFTLTFTAATTGNKTATVTINNDDCDEGAYTFAIQASLLVDETVPNAPTVVSNYRCGPGMVSLSASGCSGTYNWFIAGIGGSPIGISSVFTTPSINETTTYYVACNEDDLLSSRVPVLAIINVAIVHSNETQVSGNYSSSATITSIAAVSSPTNYKSGASILLESGFKTSGGTVFKAEIGPCEN
jgi:uncharacterized protein YjdB